MGEAKRSCICGQGAVSTQNTFIAFLIVNKTMYTYHSVHLVKIFKCASV